MDEFRELMSLCKAGIYLTVNEHKDSYQTVEQFLESIEAGEDEMSLDALNLMVETDTLIQLQVYPLTPIGFYRVFGTNVDEVIKTMLETLRGK